jgi:hypothetical protein
MQLSFLFIAALSVMSALAAPHVHQAKRQQSSPPSGPNLGYSKLYKLQQHFFDRFIYPNNAEEVAKINSTVFAENVQGRVSDTRNFEGRELNTEYIFGLFVPSDRVSIIGIPESYEIIQFVANQNIASATTRLQFRFPHFGNMTLPVTVDTWLTWNDKDEVTQYDVIFRWFANLLDVLIKALDPSSPTAAIEKATGAIAKSVCDSHELYCTDPNKPGNRQYESREACMKFLTEDTRLGQSFELGMNTLMCRSLHQHMLHSRPEVHCPHIGKSGAGMCSDDEAVDYVTKSEERYFINSPWIPTMF